MRQVRPPPGWPPGRHTSGRRRPRRTPDGTTWWNAGSASSALRRGRSIATASTPAPPQPVDERRHAGGRAARAVTQEAAKAHRRRVPGRRPFGWPPGWVGRVMAVDRTHHPCLDDHPHRGRHASAYEPTARPAPGLLRTALVALRGRPGGALAARHRRAVEPGARGGATVRAGAGPPSGTPLGDSVTFYGRGYGHGVGMSQYGARGRALAGQDAATILAHYYQGTTLGRDRSGDPDPRARAQPLGGDRRRTRSRSPAASRRGRSTASRRPSRRTRACN